MARRPGDSRGGHRQPHPEVHRPQPGHPAADRALGGQPGPVSARSSGTAAARGPGAGGRLRRGGDRRQAAAAASARSSPSTCPTPGSGPTGSPTTAPVPARQRPTSCPSATTSSTWWWRPRSWSTCPTRSRASRRWPGSAGATWCCRCPGSRSSAPATWSPAATCATWATPPATSTTVQARLRPLRLPGRRGQDVTSRSPGPPSGRPSPALTTGTASTAAWRV